MMHTISLKLLKKKEKLQAILNYESTEYILKYFTIIFESQIYYLEQTRLSNCHMIIIAHILTLSLVKQQKKGKYYRRS
jgi:hypothetical protein